MNSRTVSPPQRCTLDAGLPTSVFAASRTTFETRPDFTTWRSPGPLLAIKWELIITLVRVLLTPVISDETQVGLRRLLVLNRTVTLQLRCNVHPTFARMLVARFRPAGRSIQPKLSVPYRVNALLCELLPMIMKLTLGVICRSLLTAVASDLLLPHVGITVRICDLVWPGMPAALTDATQSYGPVLLLPPRSTAKLDACNLRRKYCPSFLPLRRPAPPLVLDYVPVSRVHGKLFHSGERAELSPS